MKTTKKIYTLELSELDIEVLLRALGERQNRVAARNESTKVLDIMIERIYRCMGVRLD